MLSARRAHTLVTDPASVALNQRAVTERTRKLSQLGGAQREMDRKKKRLEAQRRALDKIALR